MSELKRRDFLRQSALLTGGALMAPSLAGLVARAEAAEQGTSAKKKKSRGYGELQQAGPELALPPGFTYAKISESGRVMSDGNPTPIAFDGMAAFAVRGGIRLIRNHENRDVAARSAVIGDPSKAYDLRAGGGTTTLDVRVNANGSRELVRDFVSLNGTIVNCAGGPTPWGSWLSCEETIEGETQGRLRDHGYVFEVPLGANDEVTPVPYKEMGRFVHEAVAVDRRNGDVYLTEDFGTSGFYRFLPNVPGDLAQGGDLQMLAIKQAPNYDTSQGQRMGRPLQVEWVPIEDPDPAEAETDPLAVYKQGFALGGANFSRLEGCWFDSGSIFFHATNGGDAECGQVWQYVPQGRNKGKLNLVFESPDPSVLEAPDNVTISPRGGIVICEDGGGVQFVRGLTPKGEIFDFARNLINDYEFAGACYSPDGKTLFVNIQGDTRSDGAGVKGMTFAIWGPWKEGAL